MVRTTFRARIRRHSISLSMAGVVAASAVISPACGGGDSLFPSSYAPEFYQTTGNARAGTTAIFLAQVRDQYGNHKFGAVIDYSLAAADAPYATIDTRTGLVTTIAPLNRSSVVVTVTATSPGNGEPVNASLTILTRVDNIAVAPTTQSLIVGQNLQLTASVFVAVGPPPPLPVVTWSITDPTGAITVDATGRVTAIAPTAIGGTHITASAEGFISTPVTITVTNPPVNVPTTMTLNVTSSPGTGSVIDGSTRQYAIEVRDQSNAIITTQTSATWSIVGSTAVASVGAATGLATCNTPGTVIVHAVGPNNGTGTALTAEATLTCVAPVSVATTMTIVVTSVPASGPVSVGATRQFAIEVRDQLNGVMPALTTAAWSFSPVTTVATITAAGGLATCNTTGSPTVHAIGPLNGAGVALTANATLTCQANSGLPAASIVLTPYTINASSGGTATTVASFLDVNGQPTTNGCPVGFAVDSSAVASVSSTGLTANIQAFAVGTTTLRAFCNPGTAAAALARIQVSSPPFNVASVLVDQQINLLASNTSNNSFTFTAIAKDAAGAVVANAPIEWSIVGSPQATISVGGTVTVAPSVAVGFRGGAIIRASSGGQADFGWVTFGDAGTIRGTVSSLKGQFLSRVTATATNNATQVQVVSPISNTGRFFLVGLQPGTYFVVVSGTTNGQLQQFANVVVTAQNTTVLNVVPFPIHTDAPPPDIKQP